MTNPNLSAVRWIDPDASPASTCSWCQHTEFMPTPDRACSPGARVFFTPVAEPEGQSIR